MINNIFHDLIAERVVCIYLDNILIYIKTHKKHRCIMHIVLECLHQHQLFFQPKKCEFKQIKIEYLSLIISHGTAEMDLMKVAGMVEWLKPKNKKEVQAFLGFTIFYWRFISDFSHHAHPLFNLTVKDSAWHWEAPQQDAFDTLK